MSLSLRLQPHKFLKFFTYKNARTSIEKDTPITGSLFLEILRLELISVQKPHNFLKLFVYKEGVEFKGQLSGIKQHWLLKSRIIC